MPNEDVCKNLKRYRSGLEEGKEEFFARISPHFDMSEYNDDQ